MEEFIITMGTFNPRLPPGASSRAYTVPEPLALDAFNSANDANSETNSRIARNGTHVVTMLIRVRDLQLIAHREWKPADPNQAGLPL
jgi:hypothetical protein